jgi:hypothetical protein
MSGLARHHDDGSDCRRRSVTMVMLIVKVGPLIIIAVIMITAAGACVQP